MTKILFALALLPAFAQADCGRVLGTPGFTGVNFVKKAAKNEALEKCEDYKLKTGDEGQCSFLGYSEYDAFNGGYTAEVELTVCD